MGPRVKENRTFVKMLLKTLYSSGDNLLPALARLNANIYTIVKKNIPKTISCNAILKLTSIVSVLIFTNTNPNIKKTIKMDNIFPILFERFRNKGFMPIELPWLMKDIIDTIQQKENYTLDTVNLELESLGWGIQIMDQAIFEETLFLIENLDDSDFKKYFRQDEGN